MSEKNKDIIDSFSNRLNLAMKKRNMKATELSEKTGIAKSSLSEYINGKYEAKQDGVHLLSKALDVSEAWLMGLNVPMEREQIDIRIAPIIKKIFADNEEKFLFFGFSQEQKNKLYNMLYDFSIDSLDYEQFMQKAVTFSEEFYNRKKVYDFINELFVSIMKRYEHLIGMPDVSLKLSDNGTVKANLVPPKSAVVMVYGTIPAGVPMEMIEDVLDTEEIPVEMLKGGKQYFGLRIKGNSMYPEYIDGDTIILEKVDDCESGQDCCVMVNGNDGTFKRVFKNENGIILQPINPEYQPMIYTNEQIEKLPVKIIGKVVELRRKK